jgi:hypothetical protein
MEDYMHGKIALRLIRTVTVLAIICTLVSISAKSVFAQSGVIAQVLVNGDRFECVANGLNVSIAGPVWFWQVYIDGTLVDSGSFHTSGPVPWVTDIHVDAMEPNASGLHGFHTCVFTGSSVPPGGQLWTATGSNTFP